MNLTYRIEGKGYVIMDNGVDWIVQDTHIPYPAETIEKSVELHIAQIIEDNKPVTPSQSLEDRVTGTEIALAETIEKQDNDKTELQLAIAQIIENGGSING